MHIYISKEDSVVVFKNLQVSGLEKFQLSLQPNKPPKALYECIGLFPTLTDCQQPLTHPLHIHLATVFSEGHRLSTTEAFLIEINGSILSHVAEFHIKLIMTEKPYIRVIFAAQINKMLRDTLVNLGIEVEERNSISNESL